MSAVMVYALFGTKEKKIEQCEHADDTMIMIAAFISIDYYFQLQTRQSMTFCNFMDKIK